ncbi:PadR family transcriptional regulator [Saliphagus sp. LR7]|uniref:PadR family transcriptional regulator n=1 Tax=Saliphagus sp. LR7 TaxID=2282654 RepID=UPI000DF7AEF4|nr:helix-turn-helix transcriptional regulator [Saliphagus sp. LR7]
MAAGTGGFGSTTDLTRFQLDLLAAITHVKEEAYGLAIKRTLEEAYDDEEVNTSRHYQNLDALVEKGLVEKGTLDRRTNEYQISERGRRVLQGRVGWLTGGGRA